MPKAFFDLNDLASAFTTAALDPSRWNEAMDVASVVTGSIGASLLPLKGRSPIIPISQSMHRVKERYLADDWIHRDERYKAVGAILRRGVATDLDFTLPSTQHARPTPRIVALATRGLGGA